MNEPTYNDFVNPPSGSWQQSHPQWQHWETITQWSVVQNMNAASGNTWWGDPELSCDDVAEIICKEKGNDYLQCFNHLVRLCMDSE